ncbi:immune inhibitor A domain-containing protein [Vallicoccus soli]|uniref:M6 family metalloprotease domain-containing protein n=1 Tax=Vallicoccus soli TaxID=2339232 RepID=A0A3A3ZL19_9ACTN|nr:immune inhibitor A domain-containing protein [Vallicoccus soli]RJK96762.1 M6 family metalloprotease domain-containing protein [Vallicoccus soli]
MRKISAGLVSLALASGTGVALGTPAATAAPSVGGAVTAAGAAGARVEDELPNALEDKRRALREAGLTKVLNGEARPEKRGSSTVVKVGEGNASSVASAGGRATAKAAKAKGQGEVDQYVELSREKTDKVFVILAEFGNQRHPDFPDVDTDPDTPGPTTFDGPLHNSIPQPDRSQDNSTPWQEDFDREYYQDLYFGEGDGVESLKTYYERQSSGRYSVDGTVSDWVKVPYNEARYGREDATTWNLIQDALAAWVKDQRAQGRTAAQIKADIAEYDQWDRYDHDGDGDFDEPDGYIDHFQIIHAGGDEADGDPYQGEDAIWSHRWYAFNTDAGITGPATNKLGGTQIGRTGVWVGDYTIQAENGGLSTVAHEYGHDLGLPDHYDTSGPGSANENGVNWWTLMAQSRVSAPGDQAIGTRAPDLGAWDKLQLGWLDYEVVPAGRKRVVDLGPHEYNSAKAQGIVVPLPKKEVTRELGEPASGESFFWSGQGDDLSNTMTRELDLTGATTASMSLKARFDIEGNEEDGYYDYLYAQASFDGGENWTSLDGTVDGVPFIRDASGQPAISNTSGGEWLDVVVPMDAAAGQTPLFRFLYRTDGGVAPVGFFADDIVVTKDGETVLEDGAEEGGEGWTLDGFTVTTGTEVDQYDNYYIASHRTYVSYDRYLQSGPYNFGWASTRPDWVEHFPYEDGLLVSYWDTSQADNNTSQHPGEGLILPVDAHPQPFYNLQGQPWRPRINGYDAPFSLDRPASFTLHLNGQPSWIRGQAAQPVFDDRRSYWSEEQPTASVKVPNAGVRMQVVQQNGTSMRVRITSTK